ncbi:hypothetical protein D3C75_1051570 [compost metagenome]
MRLHSVACHERPVSQALPNEVALLQRHDDARERSLGQACGEVQVMEGHCSGVL